MYHVQHLEMFAKWYKNILQVDSTTVTKVNNLGRPTVYDCVFQRCDEREGSKTSHS